VNEFIACICAEPDSVYEISIRAFTEVGDGEVYHKTVRTPPAGNSSREKNNL